MEVNGPGGGTNNLPVAQDDDFNTPYETAVSGDLLADNGHGVDSDPDSDPLTVNTTLVSGPTNGSITQLLATGSFTYQPNTGFSGTDQFTYELLDGQGGSDQAVVTITVAPSSGGNTQTFTYNDFSDTSSLTLNGFAASPSTELSVIDGEQMDAGSAFISQPITIGADTSFESRFQFRVHSGGPDAGVVGDGMTFLVQGVNAQALGGLGGNLGYNPIAESVAVEIDQCSCGLTGDPNDNHMGILKNGSVETHYATYSPSFDMGDGASRTVWVDYDGPSNLLEVYIADAATTTKPASPVMTYTVDLTAELSGSDAWFGFTAGNGYFYSHFDVENWLLTITD